jgi:hypothetical protein
MTFAGWYGIIVGLLMVGQWGFFLLNGQAPELKTEPIRFFFHLGGEFATAALLIVGGVALLANAPWASIVYTVGAGMLLYSVIVSPGYFAQKGQWPFVAMFAGLFALTLVSLVLLWRG